MPNQGMCHPWQCPLLHSLNPPSSFSGEDSRLGGLEGLGWNSQSGCGRLWIPVSVQGWGLELPGIMRDVPAHGPDPKDHFHSQIP